MGKPFLNSPPNFSHEGIYNAVKSTKKHEGKKIKFKVSPNVRTNSPLFDSYQLQKWSPNGLVQVRKPLDGAYAPSMAPLAEG